MKVDRLVSMILVLLERERVSARELAERFEVSPRTVYRDMEAIGMAGLPVRSTPGVGGGFEIMEGYKLDRQVFSAADLSAILMGLSTLPGVMRGEELANALAKVKSVIPAAQAADIAVKANQIAIDLSPWMGNRSIQPYLELLKTALRENRLVSFGYTDRHGNRTARTAEPYQLVLKSNHWYFQGYCRRREDFRLFKLSRMADLRLLEETFEPRAYEPPQLAFGELLETLRTEITLRIHRSILDRVLDVCPYEQVRPAGGEHYIVRFPFIENDYYYDLLMGYGNHCECLGPPRVRAELGRRARALAALYERE